MDQSLVFELVWQIAVHPRYLRHKRNCADSLHRVLSSVQPYRESRIRSMFCVLEWLGSSLLLKYGFATPWLLRGFNVDLFHSLTIRALDLTGLHHGRRVLVPNSLGGCRV